MLEKPLGGDLERLEEVVAGVKPAIPELPVRPLAAVFVAHGMGQQIRFQTLDDVVFGLRQRDLAMRQCLGQPVKTVDELPRRGQETIEHDEERLQRVELSICDAAGEDKELPPWAAEIGCASWAQFFLKFVVSHPAVTCAIPATSKVKHLVDNMGASVGSLPDVALRERMARHPAEL